MLGFAFCGISALSGALILLKVYVKVTTGKCTSDRKLNGKTVIVTGGNTGIGKETAKDLARRGARVIVACRDKQKGHSAADEIIKETGNQQVFVRDLDLASFKSIRAFVDGFNQTEDRLDILVNNAGMIGPADRRVTEDGIELQIQTNHFGPFLLTNLLLPKLKASEPARIVMVASQAHKFTTSLDFDNLQGQVNYRPLKIYSNTKLANILFTRSLAQQLAGSRVTVNVLHPGVIATELYRNFSGLTKYFFMVFNFIATPFMKSAEQGAQTTIYVAVDESLDNVSGQYFEDCKQTQPNRLAQDDALAKRLWDLSVSLTKL